MSFMKHSLTRRVGSSMIELLVVIVIFAVGILAVLQIFPRGLQLINTSKSKTMMNQLAAAELGRVSGRPDQLPEMILPVRYQIAGPLITIIADGNRNTDDLGPYTNRINGAGEVLDGGGGALGTWPYLSGANNVRRIVGEGGRIPASRRVGASVGGLMVLQFAPVVFNPSLYTDNIFVVYGNDLVRRGGAPGMRVVDWQYFLEDSEETAGFIHVYRSAAKDLRYRLAFNCVIDNAGNRFRREIVDAEIFVAAGPAGYVSFPIAAYAGLTGGETYVGSEYDSFRVARKFDRVNAFTSDPYEYRLLDDTLGLLLFNPAGRNYLVPRNNGRRQPLTARVNYDVFDWRIIRDEFRISTAYPSEQRLRLNNLMNGSSRQADGRLHPGLNVAVTDEAGGVENRSFLLLDLDTGGIVSKNSMVVDYSMGAVRFIDLDNNPANGVQINLYLPQAAVPTTVNAEGRSVRALYMATGEWSVQVSKAANSYRTTLGSPGIGECYAGGSNQFFLGAPLAVGESPVRIYFSPMDAGKKVTVGEIWYTDGGGNLKSLLNQDFLVSSAPVDTAVGLPYIDLRNYDANAAAINYAQFGYGVRNVKGASVSVRVLWNPATFNLTADETQNLLNYETWARNYRKIKAEGFVQKEEQ